LVGLFLVLVLFVLAVLVCWAVLRGVWRWVLGVE
jgi:hypothetical protein